MFNNNRQYLLHSVSSSVDNRHLLSANVKVGMKDTYITNKESTLTSKIFDSKAQKFIQITDVDLTEEELKTIDSSNQFTGGIGNNLLYRERSYIKTGTDKNGFLYRGILATNPESLIKDYLDTYTGNTAEKQYRFGRSILELSLVSGTLNGSDVFATMLPLDAKVDDTASWTKPTETGFAEWNTPGAGDLESSPINTTVKGVWDNPTNPQKISFDVSGFLNVWKTKPQSTLAVSLVSEETQRDQPIKFFSNESTFVRIGGTQLTSVKFFTGIESQITQTNGIRVLITPFGSGTAISFDDSTIESEREWNIFNSASIVGSTGNIVSPDQEQGLVIGTKTYTVNEKRSGPRGPILVVSGISLGSILNYYTTAEFFTINNVNLGTGYAEITSPSTQTLTDINSLIPEDIVQVEYPPTTTQNNVRQFTVKFTTDEKTTLDRARIYFNEPVLTEDRTGQATDLFISTKQPVLNLQILF